MKLFGKEPAFWSGLVAALLTLLLSFGVPTLTAERVSLIMAVVTALLGVYVAWATQDTLLGVGVGLLNAVIALFAGYGLALAEAQTSAVIALASILLGAWQRGQTSPLEKGGFGRPASVSARS